jgi:ABC-type Zn uptake system ZnuABC Zn-binding protein ZnuA
MKTTRRGAAGALVALTTIIAACGTSGGVSTPNSSGAPSVTPAPGAIKVVTTTTVFADIVRGVGGSLTDARSIIPPGVGPEDYEPKPDDAKSLADAQLIVSNGVPEGEARRKPSTGSSLSPSARSR